MNNLPIHIKEFFKNRKISNDILEDFQIGYNGRIIYPYIDSKQIKSFNLYRRDPKNDRGPRFSYDKGCHVSLYGIHKMQNENSILICEGLNDCLCAWSQGVPTVTSTGGAQSFQESWKDLFIDKDITICLDNDQAGGMGMVKILSILPQAYLLFLPKGIKDISDFIIDGGDLHELLKTRIHFNNNDEISLDKIKKIAIYRETYFHDEYEKQLQYDAQKVIHYVKKFKSNNALINAKSYPITKLLKFNYQKKTLCPYHNEKSGSFYYNENSNTGYCFGCNKRADSVDIYMTINNCSFKDAVNALNKLI